MRGSGRFSIRGAGQGNGFSLIELLVVIAIIAMLMAIVTPALRKAKDHAKRVICMNNVRQTGIGLKVYSENNDGLLIPQRDEKGDVVDDPLPWECVVSYSDTFRDKNNELSPMHLGVLYGEGLIDTPEVFYCPAQPRKSDYPLPYYYDFYTKGGGIEWGSEVVPIPDLPGHLLVRTSYNYWTYGQQRIEKIDGVKPILVDNIQEWEVVPHRKGDATPQGLTALFADGHVSFCSDPELFGDELWPRSPSYFDGPGNQQTYFEKILRQLQGH